ncbi:RING/U-box superfamily protein [Artemisia annua]|uniref:RING/U-box superfamily protein n=1 Tax=Artemisia annua TaxID=35608 RepID=A0A2U1NF08_ARTAN|nr:RING/U-box superfamily protein [Artemisia annua]
MKLEYVQRGDLQKVMELFSIKESNARSLLIHYGWNVEKIADVFLNKGKEVLYTEASLPIQDDGDISLLIDCSEALCEKCWQEFPVNQITSMDCNHQKIKNLVNVNNPDLAKKFDHSLLDSYINDKKNVKWCPSKPHCGNAIRIDDGDIYQSSVSEVSMKEMLKEVTLHTEAPVDYNWAIDAATIFFRSRRIVSNLYPFSYYMFANDLASNEMKTSNKQTRQTLFNCRHQQLEGYCEKLSYMLHQLLDSRDEDHVNELKVQIIDFSSLIDDLCKQLVVELEYMDPEQLGIGSIITYSIDW